MLNIKKAGKITFSILPVFILFNYSLNSPSSNELNCGKYLPVASSLTKVNTQRLSGFASI